ncbi:outer membrane beta-barrel protein [Motilimonas pumila]|uniref:Outer membrane protein beta-barrel domain-containing protein n=1 Tax=Motilimonas pumila TaxID=2303987 RepID=A0A418YDL1_9GAMM|nr:outer membrane beta-barrel protein [Motilimonas pumila]RJG42628.1 hypothetical protein D1Z90_12225 [Motilimonas pumila]
MQFIRSLSLASAGLCCLPTLVQAEPWHFEVSPYLWAVGQSGKTGFKTDNGNDIITDMDMSFGDIWDNLDSAFLMDAKASKGDWAFSVNYVYMKLKNEGDIGNNGRATVEGKQNLIDVTAAYRFYNQGNMAWYGVFGARFADVDNSLTTTTDNRYKNRGFGDDWVDPLLGIKNRWQINSTFYLDTQFDMAGFGLSSSSDFSWGIGTTLNHKLSENWYLKYNYRYLDIDYKSNKLIFDMASSGLALGVSYMF